MVCTTASTLYLEKTDKKASEQEVFEALDELIQANSPLYQIEIKNLSVTQLNLLKAVSKHVNKLTGAEAMEKYKLGTPRNVTKNKSVLTKKDIIHKEGGQLNFLDPAFELWFNKIFFKINYK